MTCSVGGCVSTDRAVTTAIRETYRHRHKPQAPCRLRRPLYCSACVQASAGCSDWRFQGGRIAECQLIGPVKAVDLFRWLQIESIVSRQVETFSAATRSALSLKFRLHSIFLFPTTAPDWSCSCAPKHRDRRWIKEQRSGFIARAFALFVACGFEPCARASAPPRTVNASLLTMIFVIMDIDSRRLRSICRRGVVSIRWFDRGAAVT